MAESHETRIERMDREFSGAMTRFLARLEAAGAAGERAPADGAWSVAQIGWHVAAVNRAFAGVMTGAIDGAVPARSGFVEREWRAVAGEVAERLTASPPFRPPSGVLMADVLPSLRESERLVRDAIRSLTPGRGSGYTLTSPIVGEISVYQIGEWAAAHVIRHNAQAKRVLAS